MIGFNNSQCQSGGSVAVIYVYHPYTGAQLFNMLSKAAKPLKLAP